MRENDPDPVCPNLECGAAQTPIGLDVAAGRAPGIGGNPFVKSMDATANIVMKDYGMTDLASARVGESMAPQLPPHQQRRADAMFDPRKRAELFGGMGMMGQMVNAMALGAAMNHKIGTQPGEIDPIGAIHSQKYVPPVEIMTDRKGRK